jgi:hypothetical protein
MLKIKEKKFKIVHILQDINKQKHRRGVKIVEYG